MRYPGEIAVRRMERDLRENDLLVAIEREMDRAAVWGGLRWYAEVYNRSPKLPWAVFRGIYGGWPSRQEQDAPLVDITNTALEHYLALPRRSRSRR